MYGRSRELIGDDDGCSPRGWSWLRFYLCARMWLTEKCRKNGKPAKRIHKLYNSRLRVWQLVLMCQVCRKRGSERENEAIPAFEWSVLCKIALHQCFQTLIRIAADSPKWENQSFLSTACRELLPHRFLSQPPLIRLVFVLFQTCEWIVEAQNGCFAVPCVCQRAKRCAESSFVVHGCTTGVCDLK